MRPGEGQPLCWLHLPADGPDEPCELTDNGSHGDRQPFVTCGECPVASAEAVEQVVPIVEICDTRLAEWRQLDIAQVIADNSFAGGFVLGAGKVDWRDFDLAEHEVSLLAGGVLLGRGPGRLVLGHPLDSLAWLASHLADRSRSLKKGEIIAAGTCTGLHFVTAPSRITAEFGALGELRFDISI